MTVNRDTVVSARESACVRPRLLPLGNDARYRISALVPTETLVAEGVHDWQPPKAEKVQERLAELENGSVCPFASTAMSKETRDAIAAAVTLLNRGLPVGIPTETVYGLAADARCSRAMARVYEAKSRPSDNPLIVHVSSLQMLRNYLRGANTKKGGNVEDAQTSTRLWPEQYDMLMAYFWPGPLTILFQIPGTNSGTVAARMPAHAGALALIEACGYPLAAPSANISGRPSPTDAVHVVVELSGALVPLVLDGGPCGEGLESTVFSALPGTASGILRPGPVTQEILERLSFLNANDTSSDKEEVVNQEGAPLAPGMKYRHYAPRAKVILVEPRVGESYEDRKSRVALHAIKIANSLDVRNLDEEVCIGIFWTSSKTTSVFLPRSSIISDGIKVNCAQYHATRSTAGSELFRALRSFDEISSITAIVIEGMNEEGIGRAFMNRVRKAASGV